jgi:hypothetical protein
MEPLGQYTEPFQGETKELLLLQRHQFLQPGAENEPHSTSAVNNPRSFMERLRHPRGSPDSPLRSSKMPLLLLMHGADTLVFIDPSPETIYARYPRSPSTVPHRVHSEKLLATGSPFFRRLFSPEQQARVQKRRGLTGKLPAGFQYVLDLTPPMMDEDAIIVLTELSCPMSIRTWASKQDVWDLPHSCVGGQDDMESGAFKPYSTDPGSDGANSPNNKFEPCELPTTKKNSPSIASQPKESKLTALPLEYSAQRHTEGIEYVLHVLEGLNPTLDTPCKLWTFFGVSRLFGVATFPIISGHIFSWFYELNNTRFIEMHPEVVYRVACGIKSASLCREAFAGLVADAALLYLIQMTGIEPVRSMKLLVQSPICDVLDDTELQRIEYASKSFGDYVLRCFAHLAGREMGWLRQLADYQKLIRHYQSYPEDHDFILLVMKILKEFIRDRVYGALVNRRDANRSFLAAPGGEKFSDLYYRYLREEAPDNMFILQRLIGKDFWGSLTSLDFRQESIVRGKSHSTIAEIGNDSLVFDDEQDAVIRHVSNEEVHEICQAFNRVAIMRLRIRQDEEEKAARFAGERRVMQMTINVRPSQSAAENETHSNDGSVLDPIPAPTPNPLIVPAAPSSPPTNILEHTFNLVDFKKDVGTFVANYSDEMLKVPEAHTIRHEVTDILSCLNYNEYQYLPLWADGNDDGTGGVFTDLVIPAMNAGGFSAPGLVVYTGSIASTSNSLIELDQSDAQSTINAASHHATHSHVSDLMSISSTQCGQDLNGHESDEAQWQTSMECIQYDQCDDEASLNFSLTTDDEVFGSQIDYTLIDMRSPAVSAFSEDINMDSQNDPDMDTDFEFVEFCE